MKNILLYLILLFNFNIYCQILEEYRPLSKMNLEEKEMYQILKKCVLKQSKKPNEVHFFLEYSVIESNEYLDFKSKIYDEPNFGECGYVVNNCCYTVYLRFHKRQKKESSFSGSGTGTGTGIGNSNVSPKKKEKPKYYLSIIDPLLMDKQFSKPIITLIEEKPFFDNGFDKVYFRKENSTNKIDKSIYKTKFDKVSYVNSSFAIIQENDFWGIVNRKNKTIVPFEYQQLNLTKYGLLARKNNLFYFIDLDNKVLSKIYEKIDYQFACIYSELNQYLIVKKNGLFNIMDSRFAEKFPSDYNEIIFLKPKDNNPLQILATKNDKQVIIDVATWQETEIVYDKIVNVNDNLLIVENNKKYGLIKRDKTILFGLVYDNIEFTFDNFPNFSFIITEGEKKGLANKEGKLVTEIKYDKIDFSKSAGNFNGTIEDRVETFDNDGKRVK